MGCASSNVHQAYESHWRPVRPSVVLVYKFGVAEGRVSENQSIVAKGIDSLSLNTAEERQAELSREVQEMLTQDLVDGINGLGMAARVADWSPRRTMRFWCKVNSLTSMRATGCVATSSALEAVNPLWTPTLGWFR
ncbi:MAG: hypothetical protein JOZ29_14305 [Deltaproteobacteria bacterium]|nr:hypothetical protein [Deltaproteobacteria bacterium]